MLRQREGGGGERDEETSGKRGQERGGGTVGNFLMLCNILISHNIINIVAISRFILALRQSLGESNLHL